MKLTPPTNKICEEKRLNKKFLMSNVKYRISYTPKGNTKKVSILLNYHITCLAKILNKIIQLNKYDQIKIYTKSVFINEDENLNHEFFSSILTGEYSHQIFDLEEIRNSQQSNYSLFCVLNKCK